VAARRIDDTTDRDTTDRGTTDCGTAAGAVSR
jgi:hypothetical protein